MKYRIIIFCIGIVLQTPMLQAQRWVDTLYQIQQSSDIVYDTQLDFAGNSRQLKMNITVPINDTPPSCGRPLLIAIHGGAFLSGSKDLDAPPAIMRDFAKRGYVAASIDYRLGMFQTHSFVNCNVSMFGIPWNCLNMQDSAEWYRAAYRGMQDTKSAIRYLVNHAAVYQIDVRNIFLVGESAGGFIALSAAFLDEAAEKPVQCNALPDVLPPNALYESQCIQTPGYDTSIASMNLQRPDLGDVTGIGNPSNTAYTLKGVGNFYGGLFQDLFSQYQYTQAPRIYLYHQPNDLVVPYGYDNVLQGEAYCFTQFPANCQWLINRPKVYGSAAIRDMINVLNGVVNVLPIVKFDSTLNNADCGAQIANPALTGHAIDQYWLRTTHLAEFFAPAIDTSNICMPTAISAQGMQSDLMVYPNPLQQSELQIHSSMRVQSVTLRDLQGHSLYQKHLPGATLILPDLARGVYLLEIKCEKGAQVIKIIK